MEYIAPRKMTVSSLSGRSISFEKGVPKSAPPQMHAELIALGIVPAEEIPEPEETSGPKEPTVPHEREAALFIAFNKIVLRNRREDFTAVGIPHSAVLVKELGWSGLGAKERDTSWQKFKLAEAP